MPLGVTHKAMISRAWVEEMRSLGAPVGQAVASWTDFFERFDTAKYGGPRDPAQGVGQRRTFAGSLTRSTVIPHLRHLQRLRGSRARDAVDKPVFRCDPP